MGKLSFVFRLLIGAMFLLGAFTKLPDIEKLSVYTVYSYELLPMHPINVARFIGQVTPYLELLIGLSLVFGVFLRLAALGAGVYSLAFFVSKLIVLFVQGRTMDCGCFPGLLALQINQSIFIDLVAMPMCAQIILTKEKFINARALLPEKWQQKLRFIW
jgi:hypothetical protein